jgi:hypothetical protein
VRLRNYLAAQPSNRSGKRTVGPFAAADNQSAAPSPTASANIPWSFGWTASVSLVLVSFHGTAHPLISSIVLGSDCELGVDSLRPRRPSDSRRFSQCARIAGIARTGLQCRNPSAPEAK